MAATSWVATTVPGIAGTPGSRPTLPGARQGVGLGFVPQSALSLTPPGCSAAEQVHSASGVPAPPPVLARGPLV